MISYKISSSACLDFVIIIPLCLLLVKALKSFCKWVVLDQYRKKPSPVRIKNYELSTDSNLLDKSDFNLGKPHLELLCGIPENVVSKLKFSKKIFRKQWSFKTHFEFKGLDFIIMSIVSENMAFYLQKFEYLIHGNFNRDFSYLIQNEYVFIEDIFDYINQILVDIAINQCYGEACMNDPDFFNSVMCLLDKQIAFGERNLSDSLKFRLFDIKMDFDRAREYLKDFVLKGKLQIMNKNITDEDHIIVNLILQYQKELNIHDSIFFSALPSYLNLFVNLIGDKISNFLVDISLDPRVFKKLENEQRSIVAKYGDSISIRLLDKMVYLDAAIVESIRLSSNIFGMRETQCDIFTPNGVFIPKGSFAVSNTNLSWGLGRECPYKDYCAKVMKMFAAIIIRGYEVSQGERTRDITHDGYFFDVVVRHVKTSLYLKKRNI
ncbi:hypothetical protein BB560_002078 [Smittium megazygosporum]|uniref:Cytochrome P450 n=1 Tax=Smittium megazygosporum TaxID=133381 RepID=A0A2T9ZFR8_9FUNG|nr:hypothetical protein BB560_002078 [Smittium megazygosporum]